MAGNNKSPRKSAGVKKTLRTVKPVTHALRPEQKEALIFMPYFGLEKFREGKGTSADWYDLIFRLFVGQELAKKYYNENTQEGMHSSLLAAFVIRDRFQADQSRGWRASPAEIELIRMGLEATDEMQEATVRREQLDAFLNAQKSVDNIDKQTSYLKQASK